jgi:hypothetical protein
MSIAETAVASTSPPLPTRRTNAAPGNLRDKIFTTQPFQYSQTMGECIEFSEALQGLLSENSWLPSRVPAAIRNVECDADSHRASRDALMPAGSSRRCPISAERGGHLEHPRNGFG